MSVASTTTPTSGISNWTWCLAITLSSRYLGEAGSASPATRLTAIRRSPRARTPRRFFIIAQTSGITRQARWAFSFLLFPAFLLSSTIGTHLERIYRFLLDARTLPTTIRRFACSRLAEGHVISAGGGVPGNRALRPVGYFASGERRPHAFVHA